MIKSRYLPNTASFVCIFATSTGNSGAAFSVESSISSYPPPVKQFPLSRELKLGGIAASISGCNLDSK